MKAITLFMLVFALLLGVSTTSIAQVKGKQLPAQQVQQSYIYRDLGTSITPLVDGSTLAIHAYIVKSRNNSGLYTQYRNAFTLVAESVSVYKGYYRATWLYETRIFVDGVQVSIQQYPLGFTAYVKTTPTVLYYWYTNDENIGTYYFSWNNSAIETK
jgi:hypothetical protein